jgi:hypothetical protein
MSKKKKRVLSVGTLAGQLQRFLTTDWQTLEQVLAGRGAAGFKGGAPNRHAYRNMMITLVEDGYAEHRPHKSRRSKEAFRAVIQ